MIVSGDRDVYQLVGDGVRVMTTSRGVTDTKIYDREGVVERYGVPPELVPDLIGLKGDTSDNIPGVPGIGDKTAAQLLQRFGSLEEVLESVDEISGREAQAEPDRARRRRARLEAARDAEVGRRRRRSRSLDEARRAPDRSRLRDFAAEFELRAVIQRLEEEFDEDRARPRRSTRRSRSRRRGVASPTSPTGRSRWRSSTALGGHRRRAGSSPATRRTWPRWPPTSAAGRWSPTTPRALGGRRAHGPARGRRDRRARSRPRHDGRRLPDRPGAAGLRPRTSSPPTPGSRRRRAGADRGPALARGRGGRGRGDPAVDARLAYELAERQREQLAEFGLERVMHEVELPLVEVLVGDGARSGSALDAERLAAIGEGMEERIATLQAEIYELAGPRVHDRLAAAARRGPLRRARPDQEAARQDRVLHRRPGPRADPRRAPDRRQGRAAGAS